MGCTEHHARRPIGQLRRGQTPLDWQTEYDGKESALLKKPDVKTSIASSVTELVGWTPMVYLNRVAAGLPARVAVKLESMQPLSSVKDRIAFSMIEKLERDGKLTPGKSKLIEMTSGSTGIGLAFIAAAKRYHLTCVMPDAYSVERRAILLALGARVVLTAKEDGPMGLLGQHGKLMREDPSLVHVGQFEQAANPGIRYATPGREIWSQTQGEIEFFVAGSGTGGTITGASTFLKHQRPSVKAVVVEPKEAPFLVEGKAGPHAIQGMTPGLDFRTFDQSVLDEIVPIGQDAAMDMTRRLATEEGIFVGPSSGAAALAAIEVASRPENEGKLVVALFPSFGERYLSTDPYLQYMEAAKAMKSLYLTEEEKAAMQGPMQAFMEGAKPIPLSDEGEPDIVPLAAALDAAQAAEKPQEAEPALTH